MKLVVWVFSIFASAYAQYTNRGQPCITPNNENATCIAARSCKLIFEPLGTRDPMAIDFAKRSLCGYDKEPLFCCGRLANLTRKDRGDSCITPNSEHGTCIAAVSCELIVDALRTREPMVKVFAQKSQCRNDKEPLVCCGISPGDAKKVLPDRSSCGLEKESTIKVRGGEVTDIDEFPWMAALEYKKKSTGASQGIKCGGSVITERYILTAAHCLRDRDVRVSRAWLGDWNITSDPDCLKYVNHEECSDPVQKINIARIISHSDFSESTGRNDIGLLRLEWAVTFTDYIRAICLPTENLPNPLQGSRLTVVGWGIKDDGEQFDVKGRVDVPLLSHAACNARLPYRLTANQYCAGGEDGKDSCKGDAGGPLMRAYQETSTSHPQWYQEGILSFGFGCARLGTPTIYTRVSTYVNWIVNTILEDKF